MLFKCVWTPDLQMWRLKSFEAITLISRRYYYYWFNGRYCAESFRHSSVTRLNQRGWLTLQNPSAEESRLNSKESAALGGGRSHSQDVCCSCTKKQEVGGRSLAVSSGLSHKCCWRLNIKHPYFSFVKHSFTILTLMPTCHTVGPTRPVLCYNWNQII